MTNAPTDIATHRPRPDAIAFTKMNGLGNDFVVIDARPDGLMLSVEAVRHLAARDNAVTKGCDQLLLILPPRAAGDIFMQIFNTDGSEAEACGNGTRAVAAYLARHDGTAQWAIDTLGGLLNCVVDADAMVSVNMGQPRFDWQDIPTAQAVEDTRCVPLHNDLPPAFLVNVGNPHAVFFVDSQSDPEQLAKHYGPMLEHHELFPQKANIGFVRSGDHNEIYLRVWERGAGLTKACGSGACAAAIAAMALGKVAPLNVGVHQPVGILHVSRTDNGLGDVIMRGPATFEFDGEVSPCG